MSFFITQSSLVHFVKCVSNCYDICNRSFLILTMNFTIWYIFSSSIILGFVISKTNIADVHIVNVCGSLPIATCNGKSLDLGLDRLDKGKVVKLAGSNLILRGGSDSPMFPRVLIEKQNDKAVSRLEAHSSWSSEKMEKVSSTTYGLEREVRAAANLDGIQYLEKESLQGNIHAQSLLKLCRNSSLKALDKEEEAVAAQLFARAAENGNAEATLLLGQVISNIYQRKSRGILKTSTLQCYHEGLGVASNVSRAAQLFQVY